MKQLLIALAAIAFFSCNGVKKATRQTNHALVFYPAVVANIARTAFPCYVIKTENKIDSADYKIWKDSVYFLNAFYADLFNQIEPVFIHDTTNNCLAYKDNEVKYKKQIDTQKKLIAGLNYQIDHIKPIHDTTNNWYKDSADMKVLISIIAERDITITKLQAKLTTDSETISRKNKMILGLWLAMALGIVGIIIKLILKYK